MVGRHNSAERSEGTGSDMQMSEEDVSEMEVDVVEDDVEEAVNLDDEELLEQREDGEAEVEEEEVEEDMYSGIEEDEPEPEDAESDVDELSSRSTPAAPSSPAIVAQPRLKIKLKLPPNPALSSHVPTPSVQDDREDSRDIDIESEDDDDDLERSTPSVSATGTSGRMTTRQAVLASVVDSTHVSLNEGRKKKKELNEAEIALKREETARKRKHLSEKKLEDEKADTINRLLKKQSRPKNKRAALATADEPVASGSRPASEADEAEPIIPDVPTTYRWISSTRNSGDVEGGRMTITLGVPVHAIPQVDDADKMDVEAVLGVATVDRKGDPICNVEGCTKDRKYRLVRDWTRGACGISHLKILEDIIAP